MAEYKKRLKIGSTRHGRGYASVFVDVELRNQEKGLELSICGDVQAGGSMVSGGQCVDELKHICTPAMNRGKIKQIREVWERWHLNDMNAGCVHQRALNWKSCPGHYDKTGLATCSNPKPPEAPTTEMLQKAVKDLRQDGVALVGAGQSYRCKDDKLSKPCPECGYRFGSAWLFEELPAEIIKQIKSW